MYVAERLLIIVRSKSIALLNSRSEIFGNANIWTIFYFVNWRTPSSLNWIVASQNLDPFHWFYINQIYGFTVKSVMTLILNLFFFFFILFTITPFLSSFLLFTVLVCLSHVLRTQRFLGDIRYVIKTCPDIYSIWNY